MLALLLASENCKHSLELAIPATLFNQLNLNSSVLQTKFTQSGCDACFNFSI